MLSTRFCRSRTAALLLLAIAARASGQATLTPAAIQLVLAPGQSALEDKLLSIPDIGSYPVDIVFMIDSTGSMASAIAELQNQIDQIVSQVAVHYSDLRIGLVDFGDHPSTWDSGAICPYSNLYDQANSCFRAVTPLTADLTPTGPLVRAIQALSAYDGGDFPECHGAVLLWLTEDTVNTIGWRPASFRLIVNLTDAPAHDCDFCAVRPGGCPDDNFTFPPGRYGVDPGLNGFIDDGTYPIDAPIREAVDALRTGGLHAPMELATIFARTPEAGSPARADQLGTPLDPADPPGVWRLLSQRASGDARAVDAGGLPPGGVSLPDFIEGLIDDLNATCREVTADVSDPAFSTWIEIDGQPPPFPFATDVRPRAVLPFAVTIQVPPGTPSGAYGFAIHTFCDGVFLAAQTIAVDVASCAPGSPDVTPNSLRVVRNPSLRAHFQWQSSGTGTWNLHSTMLPRLVPDLWMNSATVVASPSVVMSTDPGTFPYGYYQVYGADNCTGVSVP